MIKETSKERSVIPTRASLQAFLALVSLMTFQACITRGEIQAYIFNNNGVPPELCDKEPELKKHGFYRTLNNGKFEFISFCDPLSVHWLAIYDKDLEKLLNENLPKNK